MLFRPVLLSYEPLEFESRTAKQRVAFASLKASRILASSSRPRGVPYQTSEQNNEASGHDNMEEEGCLPAGPYGKSK